MVDAIARAARRRQGEALLRPVVRPRELDARRPAARGARAAPRPLRVVGADAARAVRPGRLAHARADRGRRVLRRLPRGELLPQARRPLPGRDRDERRLRRVGAGWRRARGGRVLQQPDGLRREPRAATISTGCARRRRSCSSAGRASGRTRPARSSRRSASVRCSPRRASGTRSISGATTCRTTGRRGGGRSLIICPGSCDARDRARDRPAPRHRGGLARGLRGARLAARSGRRAHAAHASGSATSRSTCATRRATRS